MKLVDMILHSHIMYMRVLFFFFKDIAFKMCIDESQSGIKLQVFNISASRLLNY